MKNILNDIEKASKIMPSKLTDKAIELAMDKIKVAWGKKTYKESFTKFLDKEFKRLSSVKTLLYFNEPVRINEFYVRSSLEYHGNILEDNKLLENIYLYKKIIISGLAGLGKSLLLKSIFLEAINNSIGVYPIFIELRDLRNYPQLDILDYICHEISDIDIKINKTILEVLLKRGKIFLLLDGFDELDFDIRNDYILQILNLSKKYPDMMMLISSRPDDLFYSWNDFHIFNIQNLTKDKAIELVNKLRHEDNNLKTKFVKRLEEDLFDSHESLASTPLLLTIMFITFQEYSEIPNKKHLFYEYAFQTLFFRHDSSKALFKRKFRTNLDSNEFKKILSYFCFFTHLKNIINFDKEQAIDILKKAIKSLNKTESVNPENLLKDLMDNLCVIHKDGLKLTFTHRSFQEYFTALFLRETESDKLYNFIDLCNNSNNNDIINILFDMNQTLMEKRWILPKISLVLQNKPSGDFLNKEKFIYKLYNRLLSGMLDKSKHVYIIPNNNEDKITIYNYTDFNMFLMKSYFNDIRYSKDTLDGVYPDLMRLKGNKFQNLKKILEKNIDFNVVRSLSFDELRALLSEKDYNEFITLLYDKLYLNFDFLVVIRNYINNKNRCADIDIEELLDSL